MSERDSSRRSRPPRRPGTKKEPAPGARVMIVDDSLTVRTVLKRMVLSDGSMQIVAMASSAESALVHLRTQRPDVVLLDLEMPGMGGLQALPQILKLAPQAQVMVVSSLTEEGGEATIKALTTGAADTMHKPRPGQFDDAYRQLMLSKIRALGKSADTVAEDAEKPESADLPRASVKQGSPALFPRTAELVAIGASTGGIHALNLFLRSLPAQFALPIVITQHLPATFIPVFCRQVETMSGRPTRIAEAGTRIRGPGIFIAPGHGHLVVERRHGMLVAAVSNIPAPSGCLPSVDPMLTSIAEHCDGRAIAIILSGMGRDGVLGARRLHETGGTVWAQDADTSAVWGMPGAVVEADLAGLVATPQILAQALGKGLSAPARGRPAIGRASIESFIPS